MKPAELNALRDLEPTLRAVTTPILECPRRVLRGCETYLQLERRVEALVAKHLTGWAGRAIFLDFSTPRSSLTTEALRVIAAKMALVGIRPTVVVSLKGPVDSPYSQAVRSILDRHGASICLRVSPEVLKVSDAGESIDARLKHYGASPNSADLVVDRGGVDSQSYRYEDFAHLIPFVGSWRSLTCLAGSFPPDLSGLARGAIHRLQRFEWQQWRSLQSWPGRRPAFGDYAIQNVVFKEPVEMANYSASIRYTVENEFVVLRGEGVHNKNGPGFAQYNAWANLLIEMPEYFGAAFSSGDQYVADRAANWRSPGSAQTWLQAGLSHHITATALQVIGWLRQVRQVTAKAETSNWSAVVDVAHPLTVV